MNSKPGEGSVFTIELPVKRFKDSGKNELDTENEEIPEINLMAEFESPEAEYNHKKIGNTKKVILIADDDPDMINYIASFLSKEYSIISAENGEIAFNKITSCVEPDLIIADLIMPKMDGEEFYNKVMESSEHNDIPFIFISAKATDDSKMKILEDGAMDYIYKPFLIEELISKVRNILSREVKIKASSNKRIKEKLNTLLNNEERSLNDPKTLRQKKYKKFNMTKKEIEITELVVEGLQDKEVAASLKIATKTVSSHLQKVYRKVGVSNRTELVKNICEY